MKTTAFTWRVYYGEQQKLLELIDFLEHASDMISYNPKGEVGISYLPAENLIRLMACTPGQPPLTHILLCELDKELQPL